MGYIPYKVDDVCGRFPVVAFAGTVSLLSDYLTHSQLEQISHLMPFIDD